ncbi:MAG: YgaP family membrane protein [Devosia sp.]
MFKTNESMADRAIRVVIGLAALTLFFVFPEAAWRWWLLIGLVPLATGLVGWCAIYQLLGISTAPKEKT